MSLPNSSDSISNDSYASPPTIQTCLECGLALNPASGRDVCPDCAMRNLLNLSHHRTLDQDHLPLLVDSPKDITFDSAGSPHLTELLRPDQQVGPFKIICRLGRGGMGTVYEAQDCVNQRRIALKVLSRPVMNDEARKRFLREGRLAASVNHPNSVFVFGTHQIDNLSLISMELVRGGTLEGQLRRHGPVAPIQAVEIILQLIDGLVAAHEKGILHRDIKPSNCFMGEDGVVKIGDYGLSISSDPEVHDRITTQGVMLGTPAFSSPEQLRGDTLDVRSDIYALGSTLYCLLTGTPPFRAEGVVQMIAKVLEGTVVPPAQVNQEVPLKLSQIVMRCLSKEPGDRFRNYQELREALLPLVARNAEPATPGLRVLAEVTEWFVLVLLGISVWLFTSSSLLGYFYSKFSLASITPQWTLIWMGAYCLYYSVTESFFGCSLGKWLLGLRVVDRNQNRPSFRAAFVRAAIFITLPTIPQWLFLLYYLLLDGDFRIPGYVTVALGMMSLVSYWLLIATLFATARKENGWLGLHEKLSGTRVVHWRKQERAPKQSVLSADQKSTYYPTRAIGPYSIIGQKPTRDGSSLLIGFDQILLRRVWIRNRDTNDDFKVHPEVSRSTRLRWLSSVEEQGQDWDVFEHVDGRSLVSAVGDNTDWNSARRWLADLQHELKLALEQETLPHSLSIENLWLTDGGNLKLLDFPAPLSDDDISDASTPNQNYLMVAQKPPVLSNSPTERVDQLLANVAQLLKRALRKRSHRDLPPPLFVTRMLDRLAGCEDLTSKLDMLKIVVTKIQISDRRQRLLMSAACYSIPILLTLANFGSEVINLLYVRNNPSVRELTVVTNIAMQNAQSNNALYSDAKVVLVNNLTTPSDNPTLKQSNERFIKGASYLDPKFGDDLNRELEAPKATQKEVEAALERIKASAAYKQWDDYPSIKWLNGPLGPATVGPLALLFIVAVPALLAGLLFRGGLVIHGFRTVIVEMNGYPAGRLRILIRNAIQTSCVFAVCWLWYQASIDRLNFPTIGALVVLYGLGVISNLFGLRSLADRIVGSAVVSKE